MGAWIYRPLTIFPGYQRALLAVNSSVASTKTRFALFVE